MQLQFFQKIKPQALVNGSLLLFGLFFVNLLFGQEPALKITHLKSQREVVIAENQKIKVKTSDGRKARGPLAIEGDSTISIKGELISLADIAELKRVNLWVPLLFGGALIFAGSFMVMGGLLAGVFLSTSNFLWIIPGSLCIGAGAVLPSLLGIYKNDRRWAFEVIPTVP